MCEKRWSEDQTLKFVERYAQLEQLWDVSNSEYKNRQARESALRELAELMNIEGFGIDEVKNKIRSLRTTFNLEQNKIERLARLDSSNAKPYRTHLKWYYSMLPVMQPSYKRRSFVSELPSNLKKETDTSSSTVTSSSNGEFCHQSSKKNCTELAASIDQGENLNRETALSKQHVHKSNSFQTTIPEMKNLNSAVDNKKLNPLENEECELFAEYVALQLKGIPLNERIKLQRDITVYLASVRLKQKGNDHSKESHSLLSNASTEPVNFSKISQLLDAHDKINNDSADDLSVVPIMSNDSPSPASDKETTH